MNKILPIAALSLAIVGGGAWFLTQPGAGPGSTELLPGAASAQAAGDAAATEIDTSTIEEMALGAEDAPVEVIEYASFTCPHCATFHTNTYPQLKADYVDTGKVRFIYREVYFDRPGLWASMVARCGGQERFFGISEMLYDQQSDWVSGGDPAQIAQNLRRIGKTAGLEEAELEACLSDATKAQTLVAWFEENAAEDEITSTPTFIIDGEKHSNMSYADMQAILDEKLGE